MKNRSVLLLALLFSSDTALAATFPEELLALASEHRYPIVVSDAGIGGEGGARLVADARRADVVMFGENHGTREIARLAAALYRASSADQPRLLVTEVSPVTAARAEQLLRAGELEVFLARGLNLQSIPFYSVDAELALPQAALEAWPDRSGVIWGLDQEFMAAAPLLLDELEDMADTAAERDAVSAARRARLLNPFMIGMGSGKAVAELHAGFADSGDMQARKLTELMTLSHRIYAEQMGGDAAWSNARREQLMVENFLDYSGRLEEWHPLFMKFGATHLFRVPGPTVKEPLGMRVSAWAAEQNLATLNVYAECASGEALEFLFGMSQACAPYLMASQGGFVDLVIDDSPTLFDLRPLRAHSALNDAPRLTRMIIEGYDYLVLFPNTTAAAYLPGTLVAHRYGAIAAGLLLLLLTAIVMSVRAWRRHRRQRRAA